MTEAAAEEQGGRPAGVLYLCATPIGNLEDMTFRAVRILGEVDLIAAEDTRHTRRLLAHFDIHTPLTSYHEHNKASKGPEIIARLLAGGSVACVSDAGLPGIADPGQLLARQAIAAGVRVVPVPGANAALTALIASGLDAVSFIFVGFLPRTKGKRQERLASLQQRPETLIFYEAPHHLADTLAALLAALGDREAVLARELTKKFEEFQRGTLASLLSFAAVPPRGEFVILVSGAPFADEAGPLPLPAPEELARLLEASDLPKKEAMREAARRFGVSRRDIYQALLVVPGSDDGL